MPDKKLIIGGVIFVLLIIAAIVLYMKYGRSSTTEVAPETQTTDDHNISPGEVVVPTPSSAVIPSGATIPAPSPTGDVTPSSETKIIIPVPATDVIVPAPSTDVIVPIPATNIVVQPGSNIGNIIPSGRYVKISLVGTAMLNIAELQVYSTIGGENIAKGKPSTMSGQYVSPAVGAIKPVAGNITDGDLTNYAQTSVGDPWMQVDLGSDFPIASIMIINRIDSCKARLVGSNVSISNDAKAVVWKSNPLQGLDGKTVTSIAQTSATFCSQDGPKVWTFNLPDPQAIIS